VRNWNDPPAEFTLDGPFAAGSQGRTVIPGQEPVRWRISEVRPEQSYTLETTLEGATLSFKWCFDALADRRTRLTQRIELTGNNGAAYAQQVEASFGANLQSGMERIAATIATAVRATQSEQAAAFDARGVRSSARPRTSRRR